MSDLASRLEGIRRLESRGLDDEQIGRTIGRARQKVRRRRRNRIAASSMMCLLIAALGVYRLYPRPSMTFADGSTAEIERASSLKVMESSPTHVEIAMERGRSRFDVVRNPKRTFRVVASGVTVEVIGTQFSVEKRAHEVFVGVERGKVLVHFPGGQKLLSVGEEGTFASDAVPSAAPAKIVEERNVEADEEPDAAEPAEPMAEAPPEALEPKLDPKEAAIVHHKRWRASADAGKYEAAYQELKAGGPAAIRDVTEELMLAADVARWSHHSQAALPLLERVVKDHRKDPRSQLAAFTLGRVYLEELGRPREAALAFSKARAMRPKGPLADDALAHEVEAWSRAGDRERARTRAEDYLRHSTAHAHDTEVRRFGGIE